jgi:hypothetical protein
VSKNILSYTLMSVEYARSFKFLNNIKKDVTKVPEYNALLPGSLKSS